MATHLLDIAVFDMVDNAIDAIVFESRRFYSQREISSGCHRQCHLLRLISVHLRRPIDLFDIAADNIGWAENQGDCVVRLQHMGSVFACATFGYVDIFYCM